MNRRRSRRALIGALGLLLATGCVRYPQIQILPERPPPRAKDARAEAAATHDIADPAGALPSAKPIKSVVVRVPRRGELPGIVGHLQRHLVHEGDDMLVIARRAGVGFRALRDANPHIDEFEPRPGAELLVPSLWILPRGAHEGIVINVAEFRLFLYPPRVRPGQEVSVLTWPVGVGADHARTPIQPFYVTSKDMNPTWVVPDSIYRKMEKPQRVVPPGPDNPLGKYRIRLDSDLLLIHGTNDPWTVGRLTTHGCIRLYPEDIEYLYAITERGMEGEFLYEPVKVGEHGGRVYVEVHRDVYQRYADFQAHARDVVRGAGVGNRVSRARLEAAVKAQTGVPTDVTAR